MRCLHSTVSTVTLFNSTSTERLFKRRFWFYYHLPLRPARWHLPLPYFQGTSTTQICCSSDASCLIAGCTVQKSTIRWCLIYTKNSIFAYRIISYHQCKFDSQITKHKVDTVNNPHHVLGTVQLNHGTMVGRWWRTPSTRSMGRSSSLLKDNVIFSWQDEAVVSY